MMNQDQYHASLLNSGQPVGLGWDGVTKASQPKVYPMEPPNDTDVDATIKQVRDDDSSLTDLNWNNIKVKSRVTLSRRERPCVPRAELTPVLLSLVTEYFGREVHAVVRRFGNEHASRIVEFNQRWAERQNRATAGRCRGEEFDAQSTQVRNPNDIFLCMKHSHADNFSLFF